MSTVFITAAGFAAALAACGHRYPEVRQVPMARLEAVAMTESGLRRFAIHDNATGAHVYPETEGQARAIAAELLRRGHRIDAGAMQIADSNWPAYDLTLDNVFDRTSNICAGARIYAAGVIIERRSACRYNSGRPDCVAYADAVDRAEERIPTAPAPAPVIASPPVPPPHRGRTGELFVRAAAHAVPGAPPRLFTHYHYGD